MSQCEKELHHILSTEHRPVGRGAEMREMAQEVTGDRLG